MTDSNIDDKPFIVQVGKRYVRRDGEISGIMRQIEDLKEYGGVYTFEDNSGGVWMPNGFYWDNSHECSDDLISEYIPTAEPEVLTDRVWISLSTGAVFDSESPEHRGDKEAVITITDGELDIKWAT